ncbi:hypothetical protein D9M70_553310 [compost metagenome]
MRNFSVANSTVEELGPPSTSYDLSTMRALGFSASSCSWKGGLPKCAVISVPPAMIAAAASGCGNATDSLSSLLNCASPHSLADASCSTRDCTDTPTAGTAMRSLSVKSAIVFTSGLLLTR